MAKETITITKCDFDGTEGATTVPFGIDGRTYEIDLSAKREKQLREALAPFIDHARAAGAPPRTVVRSARTVKPTQPPTPDKERSKAVRQWAQGKGMDVSDRGRIREAVFVAYDAEH